MRAQKRFYTVKPSARSFSRLLALTLLARRRHIVLLLGRDPLSRLKSFYGDAFRLHPKRMLTQRNDLQSNYWRKSQKIFFPHLGLSNMSSDTEIGEKLQATTFSEMTEILKKVWWKDPHFAPQSQQLLFTYKSVSLSLKPDRVINIEDPASIGILRAHDIEMAIRKNRSDFSQETNIDAQTLPLLKAIYSEDYERLGIQ